MRSSSRQKILGASLAVAHSARFPAITLEGTAAEAGLTKAGVIYHFKTKRELLDATVKYLTEVWEEAMLDALPGSFEESTPAQRTLAYIAVATSSEFARSDFLALCNAASDLEIARYWDAMADKWFGPHGDQRLKLARYAADGLWYAKAAPGSESLDGDEYPQLVEALERLAMDAER